MSVGQEDIYESLDEFFDALYTAEEKLRMVEGKIMYLPREEKRRFDIIYDIHHSLSDAYIATAKLLRRLMEELGYE